jgi:hypothetical protein
MPNPWVSLRRDQLIPVKKVVNKKEQLEKGLEEEEKKTSFFPKICIRFNSYLVACF